MKKPLFITLCLTLSACMTPEGGVTNKVLVDFGIREEPEGYVTGSGRVYQQLDVIGKSEIRRINQSGQYGTIHFHQEGLRGQYYKEVKIYESYHPIDARATSRTSQGGRGYHGYIEFRYRNYQSARKSNRTEAQAESASIATDERGTEVLRYTFNAGGTWNGQEGGTTRQ